MNMALQLKRPHHYRLTRHRLITIAVLSILLTLLISTLIFAVASNEADPTLHLSTQSDEDQTLEQTGINDDSSLLLGGPAAAPADTHDAGWNILTITIAISLVIIILAILFRGQITPGVLMAILMAVICFIIAIYILNLM